MGEPLAEIETDKAVVEYAAEIEGTVGQVLVEPGTRVNIGEPIVLILEAGEDPSAVDAQPSSPASPAPTSSNPADAPPDEVRSDPPQTPSPSDHEEPDATASVRPKERLFATPIARRVAAQRGIDLALLNGTGPSGRIVRRDIETYSLVRPTPAPAPAQFDSAAVADDYRDVAVVGMRRAIARRLTESKTTIPHFYLTAHPHVDRLLDLHQEINATAPRKISVNDFVVKAVAAAIVAVQQQTRSGTEIQFGTSSRSTSPSPSRFPMVCSPPSSKECNDSE